MERDRNLIKEEKGSRKMAKRGARRQAHQLIDGRMAGHINEMKSEREKDNFTFYTRYHTFTTK